MKQARIPESLERYADDYFYNAHERLAATSLDEIKLGMPDVQHIGDYTRTHAGFVDLRPQEDYEPSSAVVVGAPFANDWGPNMALRLRLMQSSLPEPRRVVVFLNNSVYDRTVYGLQDHERGTVAAGFFEPVASRWLRTVEDMGITSVQFFGYSQGAAVGAAAARLAARQGVLEVGDSGFAEAPNVLPRTPRRLRKDFMVPLGRFNQAINDAAVPVLSQVQRARGGLDTARQLMMFGQFARGARLRENRALHDGFGRETFAGDVLGILRRAPHARITVARAEESRIMPADAPGTSILRKHTGMHTVPGYGHEAGDNIAVHALLARAALYGAARP